MNILHIFSTPNGAETLRAPATPHGDPKRFILENQKFRLVIRYNVNGFQNQRQVRLRQFDSLCWEELLKHVRRSTAFGESEEFTINFFDADNLLKIEIENTTSFCDALEDYVDKGSMVLVIDKKGELPAYGVRAVPQGTAPATPPTADLVVSAAQHAFVAYTAAPITPTSMESNAIVTAPVPLDPVPVDPVLVDRVPVDRVPLAATDQLRKRKAVTPAAGSKAKKKRLSKMSTKTGTPLITEATPPSSATGRAMYPITDGSVHAKILKSLLELRALRIHGASRVQVALLSGYTNSESAGFKKSLSLLSKEGYVNQLKGKMLQLTWEAVQTLPPVKPPASNAAVHERFCALLSKGKAGTTKVQSIFNLLADGKIYSKEKIGNATGYTNIESAGFKKSLSQLSGFGLIKAEKGKTGSVQLSDVCFPYGRDEIGLPPTPASSMKTTPLDSYVTSKACEKSAVASLPYSATNSTSKTGRVRKPSKRLQESSESLTIFIEKPPGIAGEKCGANAELEKSSAKQNNKKRKSDEFATDIKPPKPGSAEEKILNALISWHRLKVKAVPKEQLVLYAGYTNTASKGFSSAFAALLKLGLIRSMNSMVQITEAGLETGTLSKQRNTPSSNEEVHTWICDLLELGNKGSKVKCRELFQILSDGHVHTREALMVGLGYSNPASKGYSGAVGLMDRYGLVKYPIKGSKGTMQLTDTCFPFGRPF